MQTIADLIDVTGAADALALALSLLAGATLGGATLGAVCAQAETAPFGAATFAGVAAGAILGAVAGAFAYRRGAHRIESPRRVRVEDHDWRPAGHDTDPLARLHTTVVVNDTVLLHLEAHRVRTDEQGLQRSDYDDEDLGMLYLISSTDQAFRTLRIGEEEYVVMGIPGS